MSCLTPEQIAAAASGHDDPRVLEHAEECVACGHELAEQIELRMLLSDAPAPVLPRARRDALAAEVMARADALPTRRYRRWLGPALAAAAAVAMIGLATAEPSELFVSVSDALASGSGTPDQTGRPGHRTSDPSDRSPGMRDPSRTPDTRTPDTRTPDTRTADSRTPDRPATIAGANARFTRAQANGRDVVALRDGEITIDARSTAPIDVALGGGANMRVSEAKVAVRAQRGVIQSVTVFAGSAQVTASGRQQRIEAGTIWHRETLRDPAPAPVGPPTRPPVQDGPGVSAREVERAVDSIGAREPERAGDPISARGAAAAFREGWEALREGRYSDAIAAFDRATDPVVAEDAAYWAAIAAERAGDRDAAVRRLTRFLGGFPDSPRRDAARAALAKLAH